MSFSRFEHLSNVFVKLKLSSSLKFLSALSAASVVSAGVGVGMGTVHAAQPPADERPDIVYILCDDLGYGDVHNLNPNRCKIETPNMDRLRYAGHGVHGLSRGVIALYAVALRHFDGALFVADAAAARCAGRGKSAAD